MRIADRGALRQLLLARLAHCYPQLPCNFHATAASGPKGRQIYLTDLYAENWLGGQDLNLRPMGLMPR